MATWVRVNIGLASGVLPDGSMSLPKQLSEYLLLKMGNLNQSFTNSSLFDKSLKSKIIFGLAVDSYDSVEGPSHT